MARANGDAVPVMDRAESKGAGKTGRGAKATARTLSGPWQASFDGTDGHGHPATGLTF